MSLVHAAQHVRLDVVTTSVWPIPPSVSAEPFADDFRVFPGSRRPVPRAEARCPARRVWRGFAGRDHAAGHRVDAEFRTVHRQGITDCLARAVAKDRRDLLIGMALRSQVCRHAKPFLGPVGPIDLAHQFGRNGAVLSKALCDAIFVHVELVADRSKAHSAFAHLYGLISLLVIRPVRPLSRMAAHFTLPLVGGVERFETGLGCTSVGQVVQDFRRQGDTPATEKDLRVFQVCVGRSTNWN